MRKRIAAMLACLVAALLLLPATAFADAFTITIPERDDAIVSVTVDGEKHEEGETFSVEAGTQVSAQAMQLSSTGAMFTGWSVSPEGAVELGNTKIVEFSMPAQDISLEPVIESFEANASVDADGVLTWDEPFAGYVSRVEVSRQGRTVQSAWISAENGSYTLDVRQLLEERAGDDGLAEGSEYTIDLYYLANEAEFSPNGYRGSYLGATTYEYQAAKYGLFVGGTEVTSANAADVLGDADEGATVSYDAQTNTLTLDHADLTNTPESPQYPLQTTEPDLTIKLVGENTVSSSVENYPAVHIAPEQGETKIVGDGAGAKLTVTSGISEGIRVDWSDLAVQDCTVFIRTDVWGGLIVSGGVLAIRDAQVDVASSPDPDVAQAVYVLRGENGISITNSTVTASNGASQANVIYSDAGISIDGSTVTATGTADDAYPAIYAAGNIDVKNGSEVTAKSAGRRGIFTEADMTISNNSKVTASGTTNEGMVVVGKLKVEGSKLQASTSSDDEKVPALVTEQLEVIASDVTLEGGLGLWEFYGGSADNASFLIEPAAGKLAEFKVDPVNRDGSAADHFNERDATHVSPYDRATELNETEMNWLGAYRYVHIGEHVHAGGTATCVAPAVCDDCGREYGAADPDAHSFTAYTSNNDATCTEDGTETAACDNGCGATDTRVVQGSALGHDPELVGAKPATCTDAGYSGDEVCKRCGELLKQGAAIPALGHTLENGVCTVCGEKDPDYVAPEEPDGPDGQDPEQPAGPAADDDAAIPATGDMSALVSAAPVLVGGLALAVGAAMRRRR